LLQDKDVVNFTCNFSPESTCLFESGSLRILVVANRAQMKRDDGSASFDQHRSEARACSRIPVSEMKPIIWSFRRLLWSSN
jgi:hypothetical protein